jgi:hypothetical protein
MLTPAQRSMISGGPPGRLRAGLIAAVAAGLGCALIVLGIEVSSRRSRTRCSPR